MTTGTTMITVIQHTSTTTTMSTGTGIMRVMDIRILSMIMGIPDRSARAMGMGAGGRPLKRCFDEEVSLISSETNTHRSTVRLKPLQFRDPDYLIAEPIQTSFAEIDDR